jgi:DNA polymerase III subunit delta
MAQSKKYLTYTDFRRQFDQGAIRPVYLFQGPETFLIAEAIEHVKQTLIKPETEDFNYAKFSGKDTPAADIVDQAQTIPFLNDRRLVVLTEVDAMPASEQNRMLTYLADPNQTTCLIMTAAKLDKRKKFAQMLNTQAEVVQFWKLFERDVPRWISNRAKRAGYSMKPQVAAYLAELVGNDLRQLENELKKIMAYSNTHDISLDAVQQVVGDVREHDIFELLDAVSEGNVVETLRILNQLLVEGEQPLKILAMVTRQFRLLWKVKAHLAKNKTLSAHQLAGKIGVPQRIAQRLQHQVKRFTQVQLKLGFKRLSEVDRAIKSSTNSPKILLEDVFMDLCAPSRKR